MKYVVFIERAGYEEFEVEADSVEQAEQLAMRKAENYVWGSEPVAEYKILETSELEEDEDEFVESNNL